MKDACHALEIQQARILRLLACLSQPTTVLGLALLVSIAKVSDALPARLDLASLVSIGVNAEQTLMQNVFLALAIR